MSADFKSYNEENSQLIAKIQLNTNAVTLSPNNPYTYTSGIKSPIYCDNRQLISYPKEREFIVNSFIDFIKNNNITFDIIAGTATAGIPWAAFIAQKLNKPMVYVRSKPKDYGKGNQIEGCFTKNQTVLVIEDLISTGKSSFAAVEALRNNGLIVNNCLAIFSYDLKESQDIFSKNNCEIATLTSFKILVETAVKLNKITKEEEHIVLSWNQDPKKWGLKYA